MKTFFVIAMLFVASVANAQEIKRPDTYNYNTALAAINDYDYNKAMKYLDEELKENPKNGYAIGWKGWLYFQFKNYGSSLEYLSKSFKYIPQNDKECIASMYDVRGSVFQAIADTVSALNDYMYAYKLGVDGGSKYLYHHIYLLICQKRYAEADNALAMIANIEKNNPYYYINVGYNESLKGNLDKALENFNYSLKLDGNYSYGYTNRAALYMIMKKYKEAASDVMEAISRDAIAKDWSLMRDVAECSFDTMKALIDAKIIKEPDNEFWYYCLANICDKTGRWQMSIDNYRKAIERINNKKCLTVARAYAYTAECEMELGRYSDALQSINKSIEADSSRVILGVDKRAEIYFNLENIDAAIDDINYCLKQDPETGYCYYKRGLIRLYTKKYQDALDDFYAAVVLSPQVSSYLHYRGLAYLLSGDKEKAFEDFNAAISINECPDDVKAYCYAYLGKKLEAKSLMETFYKDTSKNDCYDLACLYSVMGETDTALDYLEKSLKLGYRAFYRAENDCSLINVLQSQRFKRLISEYKQKAANENAKVRVGLSTAN